MSHRSAVAGAPYPLLATDQVSSVDNLPDLRSYLKEHDLPDADNAVKLLQVFDVQKKSMETWSSDDYFSRLPRFSDISVNFTSSLTHLSSAYLYIGSACHTL